MIGYPPANKYIHPGQNLTVQVVQPVRIHLHIVIRNVYSTLSQDSIEGPIIVGLAIGISSPCTTSQPCQPPSKSVGDELYAGPYNPVLQPGQPGKFYQNFTIQIPAVVTRGKAQLNVVLFGLFGVSFFLSLDEHHSLVLITTANRQIAFRTGKRLIRH